MTCLFEVIQDEFSYWQDIDIHRNTDRVLCRGHGFAGIARASLLDILVARCLDLGVKVSFSTVVTAEDMSQQADLVIAADGVSSDTRSNFAEYFRPSVTYGTNKFVWPWYESAPFCLYLLF